MRGYDRNLRARAPMRGRLRDEVPHRYALDYAYRRGGMEGARTGGGDWRMGGGVGRGYGGPGASGGGAGWGGPGRREAFPRYGGGPADAWGSGEMDVAFRGRTGPGPELRRPTRMGRGAHYDLDFRFGGRR